MHELKFLAVGVLVGGALGFAFYTKAALELSRIKKALNYELGYLTAKAASGESYLEVHVKQSVAALKRLL